MTAATPTRPRPAPGKRKGEGERSHVRTSLSIILVIAAALLVALLLAGRLWLIPARFSNDPNEGWNALQAVRALGTGALYPPPGGLTGNNYPPLSFYLIGYAGRLFGDAIVAGRAIALGALLAVAASIALVVRRFSRARLAPALAALLFLALNATLFRGYVAMDDPQWLAHAVMMAGFSLVMPRQADAAPGDRRTIAAALFFVVGGLIKHNPVGLAGAVTLWLLIHHRRAALLWIATGVAAVLVAASLCALAYGGDFFTDLLASDRSYGWSRMVDGSVTFLLTTLPLLIASGQLIRLRRSDRRVDLLLLAVVLGVVLGIVQEAGQGVDYNAWFEAAIALCIAGGVAFGLRERTRPWVGEPLAWSALPLLALLPGTLQTEWHEIADRSSEQLYWNALVDRIAAVQGPVACEIPAACYWAGKSLGVDFFLYGQHVIKRGEATALLQALRTRRFAAIELEPPDTDEGATADPEPLAPLIERDYRLAWQDDDSHRLYVPR